MIIDEKIIVDATVVRAFTETDVARMMGYLAIRGLCLARMALG